jgi:hypothetical protein
MLSETEIYLKLKAFLKNIGWQILGGQPPGGTNVIPLIELKDIAHKDKGSKGSKKIDLIAYKRPYFLLIELKPALDQSDIEKLREVTSQNAWRKAFFVALDEKRVCPKEVNEERYVEDGELLIKALGFNDGQGVGPSDFVTFLVAEEHVTVRVGRDLPSPFERLF